MDGWGVVLKAAVDTWTFFWDLLLYEHGLFSFSYFLFFPLASGTASRRTVRARTPTRTFIFTSAYF